MSAEEEVPDKLDTEELDEETSLALADPDDYTQNQRVRGLYKKREAAYDSLTGWPGKARDREWLELHHEAGNACANYALDCLELARRLDEEITVDGEWGDKFNEHYPGGIQTFAMLGGRLRDDSSSNHHPGVVSCRLVISACDRFLADIGLGGKIDPGLDDDLL